MGTDRLITGPASEPVTLTEAKAHLRIESDNTDDDTYVTALITAAREHVEQHCRRGIVTQTWERVLEGFPAGDSIELPKGNLQSVTSVSYVDANGDSATLTEDEDYLVDDAAVPGRVVLAYEQVWPETRCQWDAVVVRYVVGWAAADVPKTIKQAVLLLISQMFEFRTPEIAGTIVSPVKFAVDALLSPHRIVGL